MYAVDLSVVRCAGASSMKTMPLTLKSRHHCVEPRLSISKVNDRIKQAGMCPLLDAQGQRALEAALPHLQRAPAGRQPSGAPPSLNC